MGIFDRLADVEARFKHVRHELENPNVTQDQSKYRSLMKETAELEPVVELYRAYKDKLQQKQDALSLLESERDPELKALAKEEVALAEAALPNLEEQLKLALLPRDPNDEKNVILEVRPAAGGDEAGLFAEEIFRAYTLFAQRQGWTVEVMSYTPGTVGGVKEAIASISGEKVFSKLKHESGVHRVQRVPKTETQGRVHTSTITVAVIPEAQEVDVKINPNDLRIDVFRSGGAGGQSVNTTDSAVRVTHVPTGTVVICQDEKSQLKNKSKALKVLYSRLKAAEDARAIASASEARLAQIGTGDRSERIRTYNFPQSRITDHRIGLTLHQIDEVMNGGLDLLVAPLIAHAQAEALKAGEGAG
jgi:peptide chain release factor 1